MHRNEVWTAETKSDWKVEQNESGEWILTDQDGVLRGRYRDANMMAVHLAFALVRIESLTRQIETAKKALA